MFLAGSLLCSRGHPDRAQQYLQGLFHLQNAPEWGRGESFVLLLNLCTLSTPWTPPQSSASQKASTVTRYAHSVLLAYFAEIIHSASSSSL